MDDAGLAEDVRFEQAVDRVLAPLEALASMTIGTADEGPDVDTLVEADDDATRPFLPDAELVWIADDLDDDGW